MPMHPAAAQTPIEVSSEVSCRRCRIEAAHATDLGEADGPGIIGSDFAAAIRDGRGRYYVTESHGSSIKVSDAAGNFLTTIGRRGSGPGEFEAIAAVRVGRGETLHVFDNTTLRWTVYSSDHTLVRSAGLEIPPAYEIALLDDGSPVFAAPIRTQDRVGLPLDLIGTDGSVMRSYGADRGSFRADIDFIDSRMIAPAGGDRVWSAYRNQYVVELWDSRGRGR